MARRVVVCPEPLAASPETPGATHISTIDQDGSAVSFTHSIGIGSGVVTPGLGFLYNDGMSAFDPQPRWSNSVGPNKRAISGGGPAIVLNGGRVQYVIGSPHGSHKTSLMRHAVVSLIDFGRSPAAAVASPRVHIEANPDEILIDTLIPRGLPTQRALITRGFRIREDYYGGRPAQSGDAAPPPALPCRASDPLRSAHDSSARQLGTRGIAEGNKSRARHAEAQELLGRWDSATIRSERRAGRLLSYVCASEPVVGSAKAGAQ